jgi:hypothetical protein
MPLATESVPSAALAYTSAFSPLLDFAEHEEFERLGEAAASARQWHYEIDHSLAVKRSEILWSSRNRHSKTLPWFCKQVIPRCPPRFEVQREDIAKILVKLRMSPASPLTARGFVLGV